MINHSHFLMMAAILAILAVPLAIVLGAALGAIGGLLGIGGGLIAVPVLRFFYGMNQHLAQGTALVMITPNVLLGFFRYHQKNDLELAPLALMSVFSGVTSYFCATFAAQLDANYLHVIFAGFMSLLALYFALKARHGDHKMGGTGAGTSVPRLPTIAIPLLGMTSGAITGIFTLGGGLVVVPILVSMFKMPQARAQGTALALVLPGSITALFAYARAGHVAWTSGLLLALGGMLTVSWGVTLAHRLSASTLRILFCAILILTACSAFA